MSMVIQIEPELGRQAELVFEQLGTSIDKVVDTLFRYVVSCKKLPDDLNRPPILCINDLTEDELDELFAQGIAEIEAGHYYTAEEVEQRLGGIMQP